MKIRTILAGLILAFSFQTASAALVDIPLPDGSYIDNYNGSGLDVAWAGPCAINSPSCGVADLSFQGAFGWRMATPDEIAGALAGLVATDFVFEGANAPFGGGIGVDGAQMRYGAPGDAACASPYFSDRWYHCDYSDAVQYSWSFGQAGEGSWHEGILVRNAPEPGTLLLLGAGLLGLGLRRRKVA